MTQTDPAYAEFAGQLACESAELIRKHWKRGSLNVSLKPDRTVVTETDQEVEMMMRNRIKEKFPDHGIIGEEYGNENENAEYVWILDPIDGTVSYVHGIPLFGSLYGLLHKGQPILGVINQPILEQYCIGDGDKTTINGQPVRVADKKDLSETTMLFTDFRRAGTHWDGPAFDKLINTVHTIRGWGDCYGYLMVACGRADIMVDPIMSPWDLLPLIPIITGAGGAITDWQGKNPVTGSSAIASNPTLHGQIVEMLNPGR